jgi:hypothetical protein
MLKFGLRFVARAMSHHKMGVATIAFASTRAAFSIPCRRRLPLSRRRPCIPTCKIPEEKHHRRTNAENTGLKACFHGRESHRPCSMELMEFR